MSVAIPHHQGDNQKCLQSLVKSPWILVASNSTKNPCCREKYYCKNKLKNKYMISSTPKNPLQRGEVKEKIPWAKLLTTFSSKEQSATQNSKNLMWYFKMPTNSWLFLQMRDRDKFSILNSGELSDFFDQWNEAEVMFWNWWSLKKPCTFHPEIQLP